MPLSLNILGRVGSTSDYGSRGPEYDSYCELDCFLFSFLFLYQWCVLDQAPRGGETLIFQLSKKKIEP